MRILIVGGTGNISTSITRELVRRGEDVTLYNRGKTSADVPDSVPQLHGDRKEYGEFERQMAHAGPFDCVIDMICYLPSDAESVVRAFANHAEQIIFTSTVEVYSKPRERYPIDEQHGRGQTSDYGVNKMRCEDIFLEAQSRGAFAVTSIRPAYTYGDRAIPITAMSGAAYLDRLAKGKPIVVPGDGSCLWASCHSDDVALAYAGALGNRRAFGQTYNVTGQEWMMWDQYHEQVGEAMGVGKVNLVHIPTDLIEAAAVGQGRPASYIFRGNSLFDSSRAVADLGFRSTIPWVEGARRIIEWRRGHGGFPPSDEATFEDRLAAAWAKLGDAMVRELAG